MLTCDRGDLRIELQNRPTGRAALADDVHIRRCRGAVERQDAATEVLFKRGAHGGFGLGEKGCGVLLNQTLQRGLPVASDG